MDRSAGPQSYRVQGIACGSAASRADGFAALVAAVTGFRLAAMPGWHIVCHADRVGLRCLLVDDNTALLEAMCLLLEREGVTVVGTASSTAEALRQAGALCPDVVLVDIALGDENGFDLVRLLADHNSYGQIPTILISTHSEADYAELIAESPAAGFLPKAEVSATAIRRILGRS